MSLIAHPHASAPGRCDTDDRGTIYKHGKATCDYSKPGAASTMLVRMLSQVANCDNADRHGKHPDKWKKRKQPEVTGCYRPSRPSDWDKHTQHGVVIARRRWHSLRNCASALYADNGSIVYLRTAIRTEHLSPLLTWRRTHLGCRK